MDWIKRNLYFVIGSAVALALMGLAGYYLYSKWQLNDEILGKLQEQYAKLKHFADAKPHPGSGKVDNIKTAKEQQQQLRAYIQKARQYFQSCPPIPVPESAKLTSREFSSALSRTIDQLQRDATKASVVLPPKDASGQAYCFSFAAQSRSLNYAPGSLEPLSVQLAEIKAICTVLFQAKINSLDELRREKVSEDDARGPQTDYLPDKSTTNELAVVSPYEVTFRCFSSELAAVLAGFAGAPCGVMIKTINVEPAPAVSLSPEALAMQPAIPTPPPAPVRAAPPPRMAREPVMPDAEAAFAERYGTPGGRGMERRPMPAPRPAYTQPAASAVAPASRGGLPLALDERQLKVTLTLCAVKLLPPT